jgi:hypothetical protein
MIVDSLMWTRPNFLSFQLRKDFFEYQVWGWILPSAVKLICNKRHGVALLS